jgi:hypothetical protein
MMNLSPNVALSSNTEAFEDLFARYSRQWGPVEWSRMADPAFEFECADRRFAGAFQKLSVIEGDSMYQARKVRRAGFGGWSGIADFLVLWQAEENEHSRLLRHVADRLGAPGEVEPEHRLRDELLVPMTFVATVAARTIPDLVGTYGALGAAQEHVACVTYRYLASQIETGELRRVLRDIARQESRHLRFYRGVADHALTASRGAKRLARSLLVRYWRPPGIDVLGEKGFAETFGVLLDSEDYRTRLLGMDRMLDGVPGLDGLRLMENFLRGGEGDRFVASREFTPFAGAKMTELGP